MDKIGPRIENLEDYENYSETKKCYLDGRYFALILGHYPDVIKTPIRIYFDDENEVIDIPELEFVNQHSIMIRVIIETETMKHSVLLIIDSRLNKATIWNPVEEAWDAKTIEITKNLFSKMIPSRFSIKHEEAQFDSSVLEGCGNLAGFCNAYIIKKALDIISKREESLVYDITEVNIKKYVQAIEDNFSEFLTGKPDVEYGFGGLFLGTALGVGLGAAIARPRYYYPPPYYYGYY